jgi:malonate transporter
MATATLSTFVAIIPIFALILSGFLAGARKLLGPSASDGLSRFVVYLSLPALLFNVVAKQKWADLWQPEFIAVFGLSGLITLGLGVAGALRLRHCGLADAAIAGLNASYPNTGFMGLPLALALLGPRALLPATLAVLLTMCVFFAAAIFLVEIGLQRTNHPLATVRQVTASLLRNPLVVAPILAVPFAYWGTGVPGPIEKYLELLAGAASPCALVALGLFLSLKREAAETRGPLLILLVGLKLVIQPVLAWFLATEVFAVKTPHVQAAILMTALPTGTGSFMLAEYYQREAAISSRVVVVSTLLSMISVPIALGVI